MTMEKQAMLQHGVFSWNELMTSDVEGAKQFYGELLGWTLQEYQPGSMDYTLIKAGDSEVGGMMAISDEAEGMPPTWGSCVTVDDVDATAARVEQLGGKVLVPATDIPEVGRFVVIQDPQGATLSLITYVDME